MSEEEKRKARLESVKKEQEEFKKILDYFTKVYKLKIEHPYGEDDGYIVISTGGVELGAFNYDGFNLLYNLHELTDILAVLLK